MKIGWIIVAVWAALGAYAAIATANGEPSYKKYQRAAVASDYAGSIAPSIATWQCPTLSADTLRLTESC